MDKIIFIVILFNCCSIQPMPKKYILLPFSISQENNLNNIYNSDAFIKTYFYKNIILNFLLGDPPQTINGIILNDNVCFELKNQENISKSISEDSFESKYSPKYSSSFWLINKILFFQWQKTSYMTIGFDYFSLSNDNEKYNISFLFQMTKEKNISLNDIIDKEYIAKISLNKPLYYTSYECPNFITEIKTKANLEKYTFSFEFSNDNKGILIVGDELYNYNNKKYYKSQLMNSYSNEEYSIYFNDIIVNHKINNNQNKNISFNGTYGYLSFNLGVIIGTKEYKEVIDNVFFDELISNKICQRDIVIFNSSQNYYVYNCISDKLNIKLFPKLFFVSKNYLYDFELNNDNLFVKLNNKYYFLIIFKANNDLKNIKGFWILGQPFIKKYSFTLNVDAKIIGFYNKNLPIDKEELQNYDISDNKNRRNNIIKKIFLILLLIIFIVGMMIITFFLGMKIKEERKKRANELKDDNYEYFSQPKEKFIVKSNQIIELNSKNVIN